MDSSEVESSGRDGDVFEADLSSVEIPEFDPPQDAQPVQDVEAVPSGTADPAPPEPDAVEKAVVAAAASKVAAGKEPKQLTFKVGENSVPLLETATVEWKVDGKTQPVAVKDLLEHFAGKVAWDRKYQEVANERKQLASKVQEHDNVRNRHTGMITDMHKKAAEGKIFEAVQTMIDMNGLGEKINAREYVKNLRDSLMKQAQEMAKLSPEQRELYEVKEEQEYTKSQYERALQRQQQEQAERTFQERVARAMDSANTTIEEYVRTRDWLLSEYHKKGGDPNMVTPEFVANQIRDNRDYTAAKELLESVDPELVKNDKLWDQAVTMLRDPDWTSNDVKEVFKDAMQKKRASSVSKKVSTAPVATVARAGIKPSKAKSSKEDFTTFTEADLAW